MKCYDFEYDGICLSDKGFVVCKFSSGGVETISNGSTITFNTVSTMHGMKNELTSSQYDECITATFQICKHSCTSDMQKISLIEMREIMRWLNRKGFHKFKLLEEDYIDLFFEASFNVSKIEVNGEVYGFELEMTTNRPFALQEAKTITIKHTKEDIENNRIRLISNMSDEEGYVYPEMTIEINDTIEDSEGNEIKTLDIYNETEDRHTIIKNCEMGDVLTLNYPIIQLSLGETRSSKIQDDFNWVFFRLANSFDSRINKVSISLPCTITMKYNPIVKVGI